MKVEYYENNSGGFWWLTKKNYSDLEKAGWTVEYDDERSCGRIARSAYIECDSIEAAISSWEGAVNKSAVEPGCRCCGQPHNFSAYDDAGHYVGCGPSAEYDYSEDE